MIDAPGGEESAALQAARELAQVQAETVLARAELASIRRAMAEADQRLRSREAATLVEANEQLVLGLLQAQEEAETASMALDEAERVATIDALTGLPNRTLLHDRFTQAIANAKRRGDRIALFFLDLDRFKDINDTLGHAFGDLALRHAAQCLSAAVRESDTVSRHGGDEFLIMVGEVSKVADAARVADKVIAALGVPARIGDHVLRLAASVGISIYPDDGDDPQTLIGLADAAMYQAKQRGLGGHAFHGKMPGAATPHHAAAELRVLAALRRPVTHYELALAEQAGRQAQMLEANEYLVVAALDAQQLQLAAEQAQQRQAQFLATLAHELRNPLAPIRTAAVLLSRSLTDESLLQRAHAVIERQVVHMSRLVDDLLDVTRVSTGKLRLEWAQVDLVEIIDQVVDACRPAIDTRLQRFTTQLPPEGVGIHGDPIRLAQIVRNLIDNASKYTPEGGQLALTLLAFDDTVELSVADNGIGITAEALPRVFEPFVQDEHATVFNGQGLGIGLTVARELVDAHGGSIVAHSDGCGLGSRFVVTLPRQRPSV